MTKEEIKQLEERVYTIGSSLFPIDVFFNDIRDNKNPKYNKDKAYEDLKLIVDEIYRLREFKKQKEELKKFALYFKKDIQEGLKGNYRQGENIVFDNLLYNFGKKFLNDLLKEILKDK